SEEILENPKTFSNENFEDKFSNISILYHKDLQSVKKHIVKSILTPIRETDSSLKGSDCVILIESTLLKGNYKGDENLKELLIIKDVEEMNESNVGDTANK